MQSPTSLFPLESQGLGLDASSFPCLRVRRRGSDRVRTRDSAQEEVLALRQGQQGQSVRHSSRLQRMTQVQVSQALCLHIHTYHSLLANGFQEVFAFHTIERKKQEAS